jgi:predicted nucleic acid-binding protein
MQSVFADADYWVAVFNPREELHAIATRVTQSLQSVHIVTSEMVLVEVLNFFHKGGDALRAFAVGAVEKIVKDPNVTVVPQTRDQFRRALQRFKDRPDKKWSLTDCASFLIMEERGIKEALTHDHHFQQAGFLALLRD